jgi:UDP-2,4-diacetamido-2,4,6-trideoxy-beta-L-altropyranose hydrolase
MKKSDLTIGFRFDGSREIGLGHVVRCLTLARALNGFKKIYWIREDEALRRVLGNLDAIIIPSRIGWQEEITYLRDEFDIEKPAALVVDLLIYPNAYLESLKQESIKLITLHETERECAHSDLLINYNTFKGFSTISNIAEDGKCLGPSFIIFKESARRMKPRQTQPEAKKIIITMGGSDPNGLSLEVIEALKDLPEDIKVMLHLGPAFKLRKEVEELLISLSRRIHLLENVADLAYFMVEADIAIAAGGNTMYELCYLGVPSVIVSQNSHQLEFADSLDEQGAVISMGIYNDVNRKLIYETTLGLVKNYDKRRSMSERGRALIDGKGVERIVGRIKHLLER